MLKLRVYQRIPPWLLQYEELLLDAWEWEPLSYSRYRKELKSAVVQLPEDPAASGLNVINKKIADINALKDRVVTITSMAIHNQEQIKQIRDATSEVCADARFLLLRRRKIKSLPNQQLREAAVNHYLRTLIDFRQKVDFAYRRARLFMQECRRRMDRLESTYKALSRQLTVIQMQLEIGEIQRTGRKYAI